MTCHTLRAAAEALLAHMGNGRDGYRTDGLVSLLEALAEALRNEAEVER